MPYTSFVGNFKISREPNPAWVRLQADSQTGYSSARQGRQISEELPILDQQWQHSNCSLWPSLCSNNLQHVLSKSRKESCLRWWPSLLIGPRMFCRATASSDAVTNRIFNGSLFLMHGMEAASSFSSYGERGRVAWKLPSKSKLLSKTIPLHLSLVAKDNFATSRGDTQKLDLKKSF
jgi:hypothetical protein